MKLYLASTSPRRRQLLQQLDIPFEIIVPRFEEQPTELPPDQEALLFAKKKAQSVRSECPNSLILGSDTIVACDDEKLGKPRNHDEACQMLHRLSDKSHLIYTAIALLNTTDATLLTHVETVAVTFRQLAADEIDNYVATGEPMDKAGAYAIQGGAKDFVTRVEGDLDAVIGLPVAMVRQWLK